LSRHTGKTACVTKPEESKNVKFPFESSKAISGNDPTKKHIKAQLSLDHEKLVAMKA
jgi:hypothetical protein